MIVLLAILSVLYLLFLWGLARAPLPFEMQDWWGVLSFWCIPIVCGVALALGWYATLKS